MHFGPLIPKMLVFTLAISCLTTSKLPWFMDLTFEVPKQCCSLQHRTLLLSPITSTSGSCFALAPSLHLSRVISPLISSSILGTYRPGELIFQCPIFLPFHTVHGVLKARILKWFAILFSRGPRFVRTLHHDLSVLGGPPWHGSLFQWVRQGCDLCDQIYYYYIVIYNEIIKQLTIMQNQWQPWAFLSFPELRW